MTATATTSEKISGCLAVSGAHAPGFAGVKQIGYTYTMDKNPSDPLMFKRAIELAFTRERKQPRSNYIMEVVSRLESPQSVESSKNIIYFYKVGGAMLTCACPDATVLPVNTSTESHRELMLRCAAALYVELTKNDGNVLKPEEQQERLEAIRALALIHDSCRGYLLRKEETNMQ
jgi:hypothetical protein